MSKLALLLAAAALGVAGWQALEAGALRDDLAIQQSTSTALEAQIAGLRRALQGLDVEADLPPVVLERAAAPPDGGGDETGPTLAARAASPAVLTKAVRDLQEEVAELRHENSALKEQVENGPGRPVSYRRPKFIRDLDSAEKELSLSPGQRADLDRVVEYTKRELDDLYNIPNDEGKTWNEVRKSTTTMASGDGLAIVMQNFQEMQKFRQERIPGSSETYGEAEQRIRNRGRQEARDVLTPEQQKTWDEAYTDPLFGGNGGGSMVSFVTSTVETTND